MKFYTVTWEKQEDEDRGEWGPRGPRIRFFEFSDPAMKFMEGLACGADPEGTEVGHYLCEYEVPDENLTRANIIKMLNDAARQTCDGDFNTIQDGYDVPMASIIEGIQS